METLIIQPEQPAEASLYPSTYDENPSGPYFINQHVPQLLLQ